MLSDDEQIAADLAKVAVEILPEGICNAVDVVIAIAVNAVARDPVAGHVEQKRTRRVIVVIEVLQISRPAVLLPRARRSRTRRGLEPGRVEIVRVRDVVEREVQENGESESVRTVDEMPEQSLWALVKAWRYESRVDAVVVRDVVTVVARTREDRRQPDRVDAKPRDKVQPLEHAFEIAAPMPARRLPGRSARKRVDVDLVDRQRRGVARARAHRSGTIADSSGGTCAPSNRVL